jgi:hypothetical protein
MLFGRERRRSRRIQRRSARSDVRAADLQEEPTERVENTADSSTQSFRGIRRRRRHPGEHRGERSEPLNTASAASDAIKHDILWADGIPPAIGADDREPELDDQRAPVH